ncbi:hypothetical protein ABL78_6752 [Leptomonas seymouri]|uniref:Ubiquitin-like domain-containing protein n=1 Tax=Leptomonas seymouri TaxID=5684 RepID=A0A0N1HTC4_LEPSE|nr:hypothetical protein ABL78_6752 [Leptomonas seymouri]|eukprot:KPI84194.1 hypothetical protein ABL78_6752 [Leptomonas seymouri]
MASAAATAEAAAPVSFIDALKLRYGATDDDGSTGHGPGLVQDKKWLFVGAEKAAKQQSQYDRLTLVVLRNCGITCAMQHSETNEDNAVKRASMVRLAELDLSENAGLTLAEVGKLMPYLPRLTTLQLCDMPSLLSTALAPPSASAEASVAVPSSPLLMSLHLTKLVLNNTGFTALSQLRALIAVPALEELHLDSNKLASLDIVSAKDAASVEAAGATSAICFPHVTTLSLAHNELFDWVAIGSAITRAFPALTQLFLTNNKLMDLTLPDDVIARAAAGVDVWAVAATAAALSPYIYMKALTLLCVKDNTTLVHPSTVDAIRVLCPQLATFRITYKTLLPMWNETNSRMYVVAALPTITLLNRGTVRPKERLDSELLYVQRGMQQRAHEEAEGRAEDKKSGEGGAPQQPITAPRIPYPLVDVLREKHKDVVLGILRDGDTATTTGANYIMLDVTLSFVNGYAAATTTATSSPLTKQTQKVPSSLTVAKLKALLQRVFQVKPVHQRLSYRSGDHGVLETRTPLDNEQETLGYYGVPDGAIIYVEDTSLRD